MNTETMVDQLRARRAARLTDPNTPPAIRRMLEAGPLPWWRTGEPPPPKPTLTRKRKPTVASVLRQMQRAGIEIAGCEINPRDGTIIVRTGKPVGSIDTDDTASPDPRWN